MTIESQQTGTDERVKVSDYIQSARNATTEEMSYYLHMPKHEVEFICRTLAQMEKITFNPISETWSWKW